MKELKNDIKNKNFKRAYLLFGDEHYLVELWAERLKTAIISDQLINLEVFSGKDCSLDAAVNSAETVTFMGGYRLVLLKETGLFAAGRKDASEKMLAYLPDIPDSTVMIFLEKNVDKRARLYKKISTIGCAIDFKRPTDRELVEWVIRTFRDGERHISQSNANLLLRMVAGDMSLLLNEAQKLIAYTQASEITTEDIELVCTKSLEARIFDLVAAVGDKEPYKALDIFNNMLLLKESPIMVISMIARQLRMILLCKHMRENSLGTDEIAKNLGLRGFMVSGYLRQGRNFSENGLILALKKTLKADLDIKTGKLLDKLAVELLIFTLAEA